MKKKISGVSRKAYLVSLILLICLPLLIITCKKQDNKSVNPAEKQDKDLKFIVFTTRKDTMAIAKKFTEMMAKKKATGTQITDICSGDAWIQTFGVSRTGSCSGGYSYSLVID